MKKGKIIDEKQDMKKVKGDINEFNLNVGFIEAMLDVMLVVKPDELNNNTMAALSHEARNKIERIKEYTNSLWDVARKDLQEAL